MEWDKDFIYQLYRLVDFNSILIIDSHGEIQRLYCPFKVIALINFPAIRKDQQVNVEAIRISLELEELYIIDGEAYLIRYFKVIL